MKPDDPRLTLFRELMRLWTKHGPEGFADLLTILKSGQAVEDIIQLLEALQEAPKPKKKVTKSNPTKKPPAKKTETPTTGLKDWSEVIMRPDQKPRDNKAAADNRLPAPSQNAPLDYNP